MTETNCQIKHTINPAEQAPGLSEKLSAAAGHATAVVKDKLDAAKIEAADLAARARDTVRQWGSATADAASHVYDQTRDLSTFAAAKAEHVGEDLTRLVRQHPLQALLISFGTGLLLSRLFRRS